MNVRNVSIIHGTMWVNGSPKRTCFRVLLLASLVSLLGLLLVVIW